MLKDYTTLGKLIIVSISILAVITLLLSVNIFAASFELWSISNDISNMNIDAAKGTVSKPGTFWDNPEHVAIYEEHMNRRQEIYNTSNPVLAGFLSLPDAVQGLVLILDFAICAFIVYHIVKWIWIRLLQRI